MLTPKQSLFVKEYLVDLNATQAAIRAGYSKKTAKSIGQENLTKPDVAAEIERAKQKRTNKVEITAEYVLRRINEEANYFDEGASHSARVSALKLLANHTDVCKEKHEFTGADGGDIRIKFVKEIIVAGSDTPAEIAPGPE